MLTLLLFSKVPLPHAKSLILAACLVVAWNAPRFGEPFFPTIEKLGARFAARKRLAIIAISVAVILVRLSVLRWFPLPIPFAQDEFGYLLSACRGIRPPKAWATEAATSILISGA
jgi:hypothetical protein